MTIKEFCEKYGIDVSQEGKLDHALRNQNRVTLKKNIVGNFVISDSDAPQILEVWNEYLGQLEQEARERAAEEELRQEEETFLKQEEERINEIARSMPITSTAGFDGYRITEYGGYVSGDEAVELSEGYFGGSGDFVKDKVNDRIKEVRAVAIEELKVAAAQIGCNAVVGLDFDYVTVDRTYSGLAGNSVQNTFIILTANGTAVTIEPI